MGYDISLVYRGGHIATVPSHREGSTVALCGDTSAIILITYNYAPYFEFRSLDGQQARDTAFILERTIAELGTETTDNYWDGTPGNTGHALSILLAWAVQHPYAWWHVE